MTPMEVIIASTRDSAAIARVNSGVVAPNRQADFVVLDANPLENIANTRKISTVYLRGAEVDFVDNVTGGGFTIKNPNAKSTCGCGSSFSV